MAQWLKHLPHKPDNLHVIPESSGGREETASWNYPLTYIGTPSKKMKWIIYEYEIILWNFAVEIQWTLSSVGSRVKGKFALYLEDVLA